MKYPISRTKFGAYFHQDWDLCGPNWQSIVDHICDQSTPEGLDEWTIELHRILKEFTDAGLEPAMYLVFAINYVPLYDGLSNREWLQLVLDRVETHLKARRDLYSGG